MGCADYCIDMGADITSEFSAARVSKARRPHVCVECRGPIVIGTQYERYVCKDGRSIDTYRTCAICLDIRKALVCGSWYFGMLWATIEESVFPYWQIDCMEKMELTDARLYIWARWRTWKADNK